MENCRFVFFMTCSKGQVSSWWWGFLCVHLASLYALRSYSSGASQTWSHYLRSINNSGLKSVGRTVFLVMVPGLCSQWELPHVRMEPWPNSASLDMSCWAPSSWGQWELWQRRKGRSLGLPVFIFSFDAGSEGLWSTDGSTNFTWRLSFLIRVYQVKPNGWPVCYGLLIEQHSVLVCIRNYLHKVVLVTI